MKQRVDASPILIFALVFVQPFIALQPTGRPGVEY